MLERKRKNENENGNKNKNKNKNLTKDMEKDVENDFDEIIIENIDYVEKMEGISDKDDDNKKNNKKNRRNTKKMSKNSNKMKYLYYLNVLKDKGKKERRYKDKIKKRNNNNKNNRDMFDSERKYYKKRMITKERCECLCEDFYKYMNEINSLNNINNKSYDNKRYDNKRYDNKRYNKNRKNKSNKIVRIILSITIIMTLFVTSIYANNYIDMQKINVNVKKPTACFKIEYKTPDGMSGEIISDSRFYDSDIFSFDIEPRQITLKEGTTIKIHDLSTAGSGNIIKKWDFQIYTPRYEDLYQGTDKKKVEKEMILDTPGHYEFYLSVMDDYKRVNNCDNWSVNGNHRWLASNPSNRLEMFYWYFTQANINVVSNNIDEIDNDNDDDNDNNKDEYDNDNDEEKIEDEKNEKDEKDEKEDDNDNLDEDINHSPETEIMLPSILYSSEITDSKKYKNIISWSYYDEDKDKMKSSSYKLYKINKGVKKLIEEKEDIVKLKDCFIELSGRQLDKYYLEVYVIDSEDNVGYDAKEIIINEFIPKISLICQLRAYLDDILEVTVNEHNGDEINSLLYKEYVSYKIIDDKSNIILKENGKVKKEIFLDKKLFKENNTYTLVQTVANINGKKKDVEKRIYIVPILPPKCSMNILSGYYNQEIETKLNVIQEQSSLKGNLDDYIYDFKDSDGCFEIYDKEMNNLIFKGDGLLYKVTLNEKYNIKKLDDNENDRVYKIIQYVKNGKGKEGRCITTLTVKRLDKNSINLEIIERDDNELTLKDEIYEKESLLLKTTINANEKVIKKQSRILDENKNVVYQINDFFNGSVQINQKEGNYYLEVNATLDNNELLSDIKPFRIKKIEKPVIEIFDNNQMVLSKDIRRYKGNENINIEVIVRDINRSEEHPNGFVVDSSYVIKKVDINNDIDFDNDNDKDKDCNSEYLHEGTFNTKESNINNYKKDNVYKIIQYAKNVERENIESDDYIKIERINMPPQINVIKNDYYYAGEKGEIIIHATDEDGFIKDIKILNEEELADIKGITNVDTCLNIDETCGEMIINFDVIEEGDVCFKIQAVDNDGKETYKDVIINTLQSDFYSYINLLTKDNINIDANMYCFKENRYVRIKYGNSKGGINNLFLEKVKDKDTNVNVNVNVDEDINNKENIQSKQINIINIGDIYDDEDIKIVLEEIDDNQKVIAGLYFKKACKYNLVTNSFINDKVSKNASLPLLIKEDMIPEIKINSPKYACRDYETQAANLSLDIAIKSDDLINNTLIYVNDSLRCTLDMPEESYILTLDKNELGDKKIVVKAFEYHNMIPSKQHVFYNELIEKMKCGVSNEVIVTVENIAPIVNYNINDKKKIRIIE